MSQFLTAGGPDKHEHAHIRGQGLRSNFDAICIALYYSEYSCCFQDKHKPSLWLGCKTGLILQWRVLHTFELLQISTEVLRKSVLQ